MGGVRSAVFLDRDGTLNARPADHEYVTSLAGFAWLPAVPEALAKLAQSGFVLAVVSNQRGVGRGLVAPTTLREIELHIQDELGAYGCEISAFRYCIHDGVACDCRKPKPGMILALAQELGVDLAASWMVGDADSDIRAGEAAGCRTAIVGSAATWVHADVQAATLLDASDAIISYGRSEDQTAGPAASKAATSSS